MNFFSPYIIAIDPGTHTGVVHGTDLSDKYQQLWDFTPRKATKNRLADAKNVRYGSLWKELGYLELLIPNEYQPVIVYESVTFLKHQSKSAAEVMHGLRAVILAFSYVHKWGIVGIEPGNLKTYATGRGNADKTAMILAARRYGYEGNDDNIADAYHLFAWACDYRDTLNQYMP